MWIGLVACAPVTAWAQEAPLDPSDVVDQALGAYEEGRWDDALNLANQAIDVDPGLNTLEAHQVRIQVAELRGEFQQARDWLDDFRDLSALPQLDRAWGQRMEQRLDFYQGLADVNSTAALRGLKGATIDAMRSSGDRFRRDEEAWLVWADAWVTVLDHELARDYNAALDALVAVEQLQLTPWQRQLAHDARVRITPKVIVEPSGRAWEVDAAVLVGGWGFSQHGVADAFSTIDAIGFASAGFRAQGHVAITELVQGGGRLAVWAPLWTPGDPGPQIPLLDAVLWAGVIRGPVDLGVGPGVQNVRAEGTGTVCPEEILDCRLHAFVPSVNAVVTVPELLDQPLKVTVTAGIGGAPRIGKDQVSGLQIPVSGALTYDLDVGPAPLRAGIDVRYAPTLLFADLGNTHAHPWAAGVSIGGHFGPGWRSR
ncbi:MAG: hypothetical protein H6739_17760 [Alphaproteobacteria bacterium]|nr:hypothetical protein [Alphaproteobacteria bacterium]